MSLLIITGLSRMHGVSQKTQNAYSICRANALFPSESRQSQNSTLDAQGLRSVELPVTESAYSELLLYFNQKFTGLPVTIDLSTTIDHEGKTVINGLINK